jgi:RNA polymerase sigma-70 factor (ECF subfamily)
MDPKPTTEPLLAHRAELVGFVQRRVYDRALAEDLVQAAYAQALEKIDALRDERAMLAWFYRSLRNAIVDRTRRRDAEARALEAFAHELDERIDTVEASPANVCRCVLRVAEGLKPAYADALQRIDVDGAAVKAFADEHGITASNAGVRIFRAREALRRGLLAACGACAENGCSDCTC